MEFTGSYVKAASLSALSGVDGDTAAILARVEQLHARLPSLDLDAHRRKVIDLACRALLELGQPHEPEFKLRLHVVEELRRITDDELPRYLFYRYRYDVFPATKQIDAFPPCVQIEPTSICNYRCVFCYQTDRSFTQGRHGHMGQMSLDMFKRVVDQIVGEVEAVTLASRGEPLLCKDIDDMLAYTRGKFLALKINTNAWYLDEKKAHAILETDVNTLVLSADAADPELYAKLRVNGKLDRVLKNVKQFADIKAKHYSDSRLIVRVSGVRYSEEQNFDELERFWRDWVDQVAFVDYNPWENAYDMAPNGKTEACSDLWRRAFVWWDGRMNPCDVDYKSKLSPGTIETRRISELWLSEQYQTLRAKHLNASRQSLSPCRGCVVE
jgi:MoaA/NifB/PqqE/SkfB family radical SAM enzyme